MIRVGIVGCGKVAHLHAKALENLGGADFRAVHSRTIQKAYEFSDQYSVNGYDDVAQMIRSEKLDLVIICTPHPNHKEPALEAMRAGSHILVEKPLASSLMDCDLMLNEANKLEKKIGVISQRRFYEPVRRVKEAIDEGKIGKPILGTVQMFGWRDENYYQADPWRGTWEHEGGGVLVNQAPHQLDVLLWMMGEVQEVYGTWSNYNHPYIEVEDTAVAIVKFKSGALGNIVLSNSQNPGLFGKVHIHGSNGATIGVQPEGGSMFIAGMSSIAEPPINDLWTIPGEEQLLEQWIEEDADFFHSIDPTVHYIQLQIQDYLAAIRDNREPLVSGQDGRRTVELFTAIYRSKRDNSPIVFPLQPELDNSDFDGRIT